MYITNLDSQIQGSLVLCTRHISPTGMHGEGLPKAVTIKTLKGVLSYACMQNCIYIQATLIIQIRPLIYFGESAQKYFVIS